MAWVICLLGSTAVGNLYRGVMFTWVLQGEEDSSREKWGIPLLRGPEEEPKDSPNGQKRRRKTAEDKPEKSQ